MIRRARTEDIGAIVEMGARFFREAGWQDVLEWNAGDCRQSISGMIDNENCIVLVGEDLDGMAAGIMSPLYFNYAHRTGEELFWWTKPLSSPRLGLKLLEGLETAAREAGCQSWQMKSLDKVNPERMKRLYQMRGYRASEHSYIKRL